MASRSHVYVNGQQVREADLKDGDEIKVGSFTFKYVAGPIRRQGTGTPPAAARLDVTGGDFPIPIDQRVMLIGRRSSDDVVLVEESVSTAHAVIFEMDGERYVRDLGSRTGTYVNGVSTHQHKLQPGDVIRIGETDVRYGAVAADAASLEVAGESATGYALEAPHDEIQAAPGDETATRSAGWTWSARWSAMNSIATAAARATTTRTPRVATSRAGSAARTDQVGDEIDERDEHEVADKDDVQTAQELEPLAPSNTSDRRSPSRKIVRMTRPRRALPLDREQDDRTATAARAEAAAVPVLKPKTSRPSYWPTTRARGKFKRRNARGRNDSAGRDGAAGSRRRTRTRGRNRGRSRKPALKRMTPRSRARGWRSALADEEPAAAAAAQQRDESSGSTKAKTKRSGRGSRARTPITTCSFPRHNAASRRRVARRGGRPRRRCSTRMR